MKDKNEKEIKVGDIVKYYPGTNEIPFVGYINLSEEEAVLELKYKCYRAPLHYLAEKVSYTKTSRNGTRTLGTYLSGDVFEIIGNIDSDIELLEKEADEIRMARLHQETKEYQKLRSELIKYNERSRFYRFLNKINI